jgi:paraquat-inducible protein A
LDADAIWDAIGRRSPPGRGPDTAPATAALSCPAAPAALSCIVCDLVTAQPEGTACPRCHARLHRRKQHAIARTWALTIAAATLYLPANMYPVMTITYLGQGDPATILGGLEELAAAGLWPLAALVFVASITIPLLKLLALATLLITTGRGSGAHLRDRTRLYRIIEFIGRWSMIDVFVVAILVALLRLGVIASVQPGIGAVAFASVVVLTMLATISFDPRLMWDRAGANRPA